MQDRQLFDALTHLAQGEEHGEATVELVLSSK
jgi:hypothetical protein